MKLTRAESLALLAENARYARQGWLLPTVPDHRAYDAARQHGTAAVREIRNPFGTCDAIGKFHQTENAIREARLAVRSALRAVGLRTL